MLNDDRLVAIEEELLTVEHRRELSALVADMLSGECRPYAENYQVVLWIKGALKRLRVAAMAAPVVEAASVQGVVSPLVRSATVTRSTRKYKLLSDDVSWSTKPQVHAVMNILTAHLSIGDIIDEGEIVKMMVANEAVLETRQGGKRVWDYYKGNGNDGLLVHGNVEKI